MIVWLFRSTDVNTYMTIIKMGNSLGLYLGKVSPLDGATGILAYGQRYRFGYVGAQGTGYLRRKCTYRERIEDNST